MTSLRNQGLVCRWQGVFLLHHVNEWVSMAQGHLVIRWLPGFQEARGKTESPYFKKHPERLQNLYTVMTWSKNSLGCARGCQHSGNVCSRSRQTFLGFSLRTWRECLQDECQPIFSTGSVTYEPCYCIDSFILSIPPRLWRLVCQQRSYKRTSRGWLGNTREQLEHDNI